MNNDSPIIGVVHHDHALVHQQQRIPMPIPMPISMPISPHSMTHTISPHGILVPSPDLIAMQQMPQTPPTSKSAMSVNNLLN